MITLIKIVAKLLGYHNYDQKCNTKRRAIFNDFGIKSCSHL